MNVEITKEVQNPLLHRIDVYFKVINSVVTPTRHDVKKKIIALKNADPARVVIDSIKQETGKKESTGYAKVYETEDFMNKIESNYKIKRNTFKEKKATPEKIVL